MWWWCRNDFTLAIVDVIESTLIPITNIKTK